MGQRRQNPPSHRHFVESRQNSDPATAFKRSFLDRFFVRFHMTLLLAGVCASGLLASKLLLEFGLRSMFFRYLIAVCVSYAVFFFLIRIWLWHVTGSSKYEPRLPDVDVVDAADLGRMSVDVIPER
ncbi:MAG: hypothetical protein AABN33_17940 [Acidobacteriota bacterium]